MNISNNINKNKKTKKIRRNKKINKNLKTIKNTRPDLKIPIVRPNKLKVGTIRKGRDEKNWKVNTYKSGPKKGTKKWVRASITDVRCSNYLSKSIKENIGKYKNNNSGYKSVNQAIAIAYSMTKKKFPKCKLLDKQQ